MPTTDLLARRLFVLGTLAGFLLSVAAVAGDGNGLPLPAGPDFKDVLSLRAAGRPRISPDGTAVVYTVRATEWENNRYDTEIYLARQGEEPLQLTRTRDKSSEAPEWSPDGRWIAFLADRGEESQVHVIRAAGGEAMALTKIDGGVDAFEWSPDGRFMALLLTEPESKDDEKRQERYGRFAVEDAEVRMQHLWWLDVAMAMTAEGDVERPEEKGKDEDEDEDEDGEGDEGVLRRLTGGDGFTVDSFAISPDGAKIAFAHQPDPLINSSIKSDLSVLDVESGEIQALVERPGYDSEPIYSPDGEWVLFSTSDEKLAYYDNDELAKVPSGGGPVTLLTGDFDENADAVDWVADGIRFLAHQRTSRRLFHLDPQTREIRQLTDTPPYVEEADFTADGKNVALAGFGGATLTEIYRGAVNHGATAVTKMSEQVADWPQPVNEVIEWTSRDGTKIEGVLIKPPDFEPGRRYPLLVVIHGGPSWLAMPQRVHGYVYPVAQWLAKGAVVLMPNYRGSTGYGEAFRRLNVRNLGVGDAWDVLSGVDSLIAQGVADPERLGAMGWSQGGYISAFLTTTSDRFKAISVGAGISDWMTYYVNTDIHPFTRHYLEATPWDDPEIYAKTSPMHYIRQARTPTLIQHGENDRRVPIPNAYELFQGLEDEGVDVRLIVYKDFGHGITRPKERLAAMWHNWQWFAKYLWGEEVELPLE